MECPLVAVVLAGGTGTRLYPASSADRPKQFLTLGGDRSLLERTVDRVGFADERYVVTRPEYADTVREHAPGCAVIEEPAPRDTGPALVYAAARIRDQLGDCVLLCLPSDHHVGGDFETTARNAARVAEETGGLVTIGIDPDRPATGYGYIEPERNNGTDDKRGGKEQEQAGEGTNGSGPESTARMSSLPFEFDKVAQFVEKPDEATAGEYLEAGWYWNAGIFAWTPTALLDAAKGTKLEPIVEATNNGDAARGFEAVDPASIDHAVLEHESDLYVVPASFEWDDLGTWDAVGRVLGTDERDNASIGDAKALDTERCVLATDGRLDAIGVSDLVIASFGTRTLVIDRSESQRVREVVDRRRDQESEP